MLFASYRKENSTQHIASSLLKFSLPLILSGVLQQLYNWVDAFIVGNVEGELALAAIGASSPVINLYVMSISGFCLGLGILFAQKYGSQDTASIPQLLCAFSLLLGLLFVVLTVVGIWQCQPLLQLLHTTADTLDLAKQYLQIVFAGVPFLAVYNVYAAALRGIGDSRAPFYSIVFSSLVNVLLDLIFVLLLHWGVAGAAWATLISQAAMTVYLLVYAVRKHAVLRFRLSWGTAPGSIVRQGLRWGLPPMLQSSISALGSLLLQNFMNGFDTQTVAAITTAYRVDSIILLPIINLGSGISTLVAQSYGAGESGRSRKILLVGTLLMLLGSLLLTVLIIPTGGFLIAMFGAGADAVAIGQNFFQRIACFYVVYGLATALRGYLEGVGDVLYSSIAGIVSLCTRIAASYALASLYGNMIIAYAEAFSWGVLLLLYLIRLLCKRAYRKAVLLTGSDNSLDSMGHAESSGSA